jgi:hypothetical protein
MRIALAVSALASALALASCATEGPGAMPSQLPRTPVDAPRFGGAQEEEILKVVDRFMLAIGNHDGKEMEELMITEGVSYFQRREPGNEANVRPMMNASLMEQPSAADPFIERYWNPVVEVRGGIAMVWAPYELRDNGAVEHCGIDALNLIFLDGAWRVANVMSTMEPKACDEMRPPSVSAMRPRDGWRETPNQ